MKINSIKIDKTANYPRSFYKKFKAEQKQYKDKTDTNPKEENNCMIEEVDCAKAFSSLSYTEPKYILQGRPVKKIIKTEDKRQTKNDSGNIRTDKVSTEIRSTEIRSTENRSTENRSTENRSNENRSIENRSNENRSNVNRNNEKRSNVNRSNLNRSKVNRNTENRSSENRSSEKRSAEKRSFEKSSTEKVRIENISTNSESTIKSNSNYPGSNTEDERCVIEEVDCKMSLINIGYDETEEEEVETESEFEAILEDEFSYQTADTANGESADTLTEPQTVDSSVNIDVDLIPEYDINRYFSSGIIDTVVLYTDDKEDVEEAVEEIGTISIAKDDKVIDINDKINEKNSDENNKTGENYVNDIDNINKEYNSNAENNSSMEYDSNVKNDGSTEYYGNMGNDGSTENNSNMNQKLEINLSNEKISETKNRKNPFKKENPEINKLEKLLHLGALHIKNKFGFLSLLALFGLLGIFTENKACLGFWAFLYYIRYFFIIPDEYFKDDLQKAATPAFVTGIAIFLLSIVLETLFHNALLFIIGTGIGTVISIIAFTVYLAIIQRRRNVERNI